MILIRWANDSLWNIPLVLSRPTCLRSRAIWDRATSCWHLSASPARLSPQRPLSAKTITWLSRKTFKLLGPSIGQIFPGRFSTGYSFGSSWSGFLRVLQFPPPEKLISSSSFHRLDMILAVAEAINPDKPNQTEDFHKTPGLEDTPCTWCMLKLNLSLQSKFCGNAG